MKYIKKVILENFQSHKQTVIDLDEGLNVITGPSDSGKTAVIRAIKWVLYNEPAGDYFIREGENNCIVTLEFSDTSLVKRFRSRSKNMYYLKDKYGQINEFEGFGSKVPEEIIDITGIKKISLDINESISINLGEQLEGAFLLSEKNSVKASAIGRLVGVNIIDDALRELLKDTRALSMDKKKSEENISSLEEELEKFQHLDELKIKYNELNEIKTTIINNSAKLDKLKRLKNSFNKNKKEMQNNLKLVDRLKSVNTLSELIHEIDNIHIRYKYLNNHHINLAKIKKTIKESKWIISSLKHLDILEEKLNIVNGKTDKSKKLITANDRLSKTTNEISKLNITIVKLSNLNKIERTINSLVTNNTNRDSLHNIKTKLDRTRESLNKGKSYLHRLKDIGDIENHLLSIEKKYDSLKLLKELSNKYKDIENKKKDQIGILNKLYKTNDELLKDYKNLLIGLDSCPFCFNKINDGSIDHIINHYLEVI